MDKKETDFITGSTCEWIRALDAQGNSIKISVADLMKYVPGIGLAFSISGLPPAGINIVGDHDGWGSGYGWYNNTGTGDSDFAPGGSAGIFIRFNSSINPITLFLITAGGAKSGQLWWRPDGGICSKVNG